MWLEEWDPLYKPPSDPTHKNVSAFLCQVLGWNGIKFRDKTILCNNGSKWLKADGISHNLDTITECASETKFTENTDFYDKTTATERRTALTHKGVQIKNAYYGIDEANHEEEEESPKSTSSENPRSTSSQNPSLKSLENTSETIAERVRRRYLVL